MLRGKPNASQTLPPEQYPTWKMNMSANKETPYCVPATFAREFVCDGDGDGTFTAAATSVLFAGYPLNVLKNKYIHLVCETAWHTITNVVLAPRRWWRQRHKCYAATGLVDVTSGIAEASWRQRWWWWWGSSRVRASNCVKCKIWCSVVRLCVCVMRWLKGLHKCNSVSFYSLRSVYTSDKISFADWVLTGEPN